VSDMDSLPEIDPVWAPEKSAFCGQFYSPSKGNERGFDSRRLHLLVQPRRVSQAEVGAGS
jgi:hypothetical protein